MLTYSVGCMQSEVKQFVFPAGEVGVQLQQPVDGASVVKIKAHIHNSDDIMSLLMLNDAIRRQAPAASVILDMPYIPYARQDRVCNEGESLSIVVFAQLINSCGFSEVRVVDPHSDVAPALIKNATITESYGLLKKDLSSYYVVAPDAGAYKKAYKWAQKRNALGVITANKVRDVKTGRVVSVTVDKDVAGLNLLVVDDLVDGGATFKELAKCLTAAHKVDLWVTHGIFSKGIKELTDTYNHIYTTNSFHGIVPDEMKNDKITWKEV